MWDVSTFKVYGNTSKTVMAMAVLLTVESGEVNPECEVCKLRIWNAKWSLSLFTQNMISCWNKWLCQQLCSRNSPYQTVWNSCMIYEVSTPVLWMIHVFWDVTLHCRVSGYWNFEGNTVPSTSSIEGIPEDDSSILLRKISTLKPSDTLSHPISPESVAYESRWLAWLYFTSYYFQFYWQW